MVVYCFSLCGHPAGTNEIASPLCRHSRRVRTRLLQVALLHSTGGRLARLARLHSTRGQVPFLRLCSTGTLGGQAAIFRRPGGRSRVALRSKGGLRGHLGALHTLGAMGTKGRSRYLSFRFWTCDGYVGLVMDWLL